MHSLAAILVVTLFIVSACFAGEDDPAELEKKISQLNETLWSKEVKAQQHEETIIRFWDDLRAAKDRYTIVKDLPLEQIKLADLGEPMKLPLNIERLPLQPNVQTLNEQQWHVLLDQFKTQGYEIIETEWHQSQFDIEADGSTRSTFNILLHFTNPKLEGRYVVKGPIVINWSSAKDRHGNYKIKSVDSTKLTVLRRTGKPGFSRAFSWEAPALGKHTLQLKQTAQPEALIAYDLDRNGLSEIIFAGWNLVLWNRGGGQFDQTPLVENAPASIVGAIVADFTGDGNADLILAPLNQPLHFYEGLPTGRFAREPRKIEAPGKPLNSVLSMTAGDVDNDGALDLFVTQYKWMYLDGQMPAPTYYDANDSYPSYLLRNDGKGNFTDVTEKSGLAAKRFRRTYSACFMDLDNDNDLDLIVASDYCGMDVYSNDGKGSFTDITDKTLAETKLFGMSLSVGDYNADGKLDFYATGMGSTTARRLEYMKLRRADMPGHDEMRLRMGYGNRMYVAAENGAYVEPPFKDSVARTGWSWGCTTIDFNNDSYPDLYVANGLQSGKSSRDYCTEYWRHDVYIRSPSPSPKMEGFFSKRLNELRKGLISWNGFEHNNLLMNLGGKDFVNVAFLMDVAYENDCRAVVSDDLNLDGRPDLLISETGGEKDAAVHLAVNTLKTENHFVGVQLREEGSGFSPVGAKILVKTPSRTLLTQLVTGDSYIAQHSNARHFGLGSEKEIEFIEVKWVNGKTKRIDKPAVDKYHYIAPDK
ncbi:MAG TPA: CRTAC1 family protein [Planctomycetota bacterium]|nr:CRTAC1 family protein [Planctomycetota bacterium]